MRLIINNASTFKGGAEQVALSFIEECKQYPQHEFAIIIGKTLSTQINIDEYPDNFLFHVLEKRPATSFQTFYKTMRWFRNLEKEFHPDCVISTGGHGYWKPKAKHVSGYNMAHYIYKESPYFKLISTKKKIFWKLKKKFDFFFFGRTDALIGQTQDVCDRLKQQFPHKPIYQVSNTIHSAFKKPAFNERKLPEKFSGEIRLLTVSAHYKHKNLSIIPKVIDRLIEKGVKNVRFVLTLPPNAYNDLVVDKKHEKYIYNVGPTPIKEVPALYDESDFMFLPTLLECFSASYVEAMYMKRPILTSDLGFAHTVCGNAAIYFNPLNPEDISNKIITLLEDTALQEKLVNNAQIMLRSYNTPESRAEQFLEVCQKVVDYST